MLDNFTYFFFNSIKVHNIKFSELYELINKCIVNKSKLVVFYINAHIIELSYFNLSLKEVFNSSNINYQDGIGIWFASKLLSINKNKRINFTDISISFLKHCEKMGYDLFLLGNTDERLKKAVKNINNKFPKLIINGTQNGFNFNNDELIKTINNSKSKILLVGMGSPKQEIWIHNNKDMLNSNVIMAVGDAITYWAGEKVRGPKLFRKLGFEWFFRAVSNPKNYLKRYFFGIPKFFYHLILEKKKNH